MWYQCTECVFATNSPRQAQRHTDHTKHEVAEEADQ